MEGPSAAYQTWTAWEHEMEQTRLLETNQNPKRAFHTLCHGLSGPYHLPTLSQSKWITLLCNSDLLSQASRGLRNHLRHDKGNILKFTGVFTYKEKNLQLVHLISLQADIFEKNSRFRSLTVIILKANQRINSVSFGGKSSKDYINYLYYYWRMSYINLMILLGLCLLIYRSYAI